jgi:RNA polymerase sigma-70 factor (ECF subfamily)
MEQPVHDGRYAQPGGFVFLLKRNPVHLCASKKQKMSKSVCEEQHFGSLYKEFSRPLRNFVYYRTGDLERAEDIVQEAMIRMWQNCSEILFEKAKSFLYTVSHRLLIDNARHDKVKLEFIKSSGQEHATDPSYELEKKEFEKILEQAISGLTETQREAFLMNRIDKMTYAEIAEVLGISVKAVEKRIHLALQSLKEKVKELKKIKI